MSTLRSQLHDLAGMFAEQVLGAIRGATFQGLVSSGGEGAVGTAVARGLIAKMLDRIVLLVKTQKNGLRAEEIRSKLGMQAKEMPRILKEGISTKKLTSKGHKRATTYAAR